MQVKNDQKLIKFANLLYAQFVEFIDFGTLLILVTFGFLNDLGIKRFVSTTVSK